MINQPNPVKSRHIKTSSIFSNMRIKNKYLKMKCIFTPLPMTIKCAIKAQTQFCKTENLGKPLHTFPTNTPYLQFINKRYIIITDSTVLWPHLRRDKQLSTVSLNKVSVKCEYKQADGLRVFWVITNKAALVQDDSQTFTKTTVSIPVMFLS